VQVDCTGFSNFYTSSQSWHLNVIVYPCFGDKPVDFSQLCLFEIFGIHQFLVITNEQIMKKLALVFLIAVSSFNCVLGQDNCISTMSEGMTYKEVIAILKDSTHPLNNEWLSNQPQRACVIRFVEKQMDTLFMIRNNWYQYKGLTRRDTIDRSWQENLVTSYQNHFDTEVNPRLDRLIMSKGAFKAKADSLIYCYEEILERFLLIDTYYLDEDMIRMGVSEMTLQDPLEVLLNYYEHSLQKDGHFNMPEEMRIRNLKIISTRLSTVQAKNYILYQSPYAQNKKIKTIEFSIDNDVFMFDRYVWDKGLNQDREYTGGGTIGFTTDYIKWRWLNLRWLNCQLLCELICGRKKNSENEIIQSNRQMLSYQSIKLGMQFYTPYIKYRNNYDLADSIHLRDRPFGSYVYLERSKFRIWAKGLARLQGDFQIGKIGTELGRNVQATLHKDVSVSSQKVYGWTRQVHHGGRWAFQINKKLDLLLFSNTNSYISFLHSPFPKNNTTNTKTPLPWKRLNIYSSSEVFCGTYYTAFGTGVFFSASDFKKQSGQNMLLPAKRNDKLYAFNWDVGIRYRRVVHNTMLEGFGILKTDDDDVFDDENKALYVLKSDQINRNLFIVDAKLAMRFRKMSVFYTRTFNTKEHKVGSENIDYKKYIEISTTMNRPNTSQEDKAYFNGDMINELQKFDKRKWYGFGRIGLIWLVE
jgi:hypothetical protein